ncbi:MAG TPA: DUF4147 domain-containing protein [Anaerolineales bacterium]|nr:DUF4147 domain-containing protein [Anaerolineales bacterium]
MANASRRLRSDARLIWRRGVAAADAFHLTRTALRLERDVIRVGKMRVPLEGVGTIAVIGGGKAGAGMSRAVEQILGPKLLSVKNVHGWVQVPDRTVRPLRAIQLWGARTKPDNRPTRRGVAGTRRIESILESLGESDLALCLLSGGASALLPAPVPGVSLADKRRVTALLQEAGAPIHEINAVRKHLSRVKGGGWARLFGGRRLIALILSDVVGDPIDVIASGPTAPDRTTFAEAIRVLRRYGLWERSPRSVRTYLTAGARGRHSETLKRLPGRVTNTIIGNNRTALDGAARAARTLGYHVSVLSPDLEGEASQAGSFLSRLARSVRDEGKPVRPPACLLAGGETTVSLGKSRGLGGRNQELALAALAAFAGDGMRDILILSAGTDGEDGPTDAAGAIADAQILRRARARGLDPEVYLARHDSYNFFAPLGGLLKTGPTGTNVMDLQVVLVGS